MSTTIATFTARNDDGKITIIHVQAGFDGRFFAESDDIGMGHQYDENEPKKIAAELARRSGYDLCEAEKKSTTFAEFTASRKHVNDLSIHIDTAEDVPGFIYLDSYYIIEALEKSTDREGNDQWDNDYVVILGSSEDSFGDDVEAAEKFLWFNFVMPETNSDLTAVKFSFGDDESHDGFADGSTWNGFDNIRVAPEVHKKIVDEMRELDANNIIDAEDALESFDEMEPDAFGLYDYGNGFATQIDYGVEVIDAEVLPMSFSSAPEVVQTEADERKFACVWGMGYDEAAEIKSIDFFSKAVGYDDEMIAAIEELETNETWRVDDLAFHTVTRVA